MTKAFRRYLRDYRASLLTDHVRRFIAGDDNPALEHEARARAAVTLDMLMLDFPAIAKFYEPPEGAAETPPWQDPLTAELPPEINEAIESDT